MHCSAHKQFKAVGIPPPPNRTLYHCDLLVWHGRDADGMARVLAFSPLRLPQDELRDPAVMLRHYVKLDTEHLCQCGCPRCVSDHIVIIADHAQTDVT